MNSSEILKTEDTGFIEKIAEMMGGGFGVCDGAGRGLYPVSDLAIDLPDDDGGIVSLGGRMFCAVRAEGRDLWFYCDIPEGGKDAFDGAAKALKLAALFYLENNSVSAARKNEFFRQLLLGGRDSVTQGDFAAAAGKNNPSQEYTVLLVTLDRRNLNENLQESSLCEVAGLLEYAFPERDGFVTVKMRSDACAVIVPLSDEMKFENAVEAAESAIETVRSELALEVTVSVGMKVKQLKNIDASFKSAEKALLIGESFDMEGSVYLYDRLGVARILYGQKRDVCESYLREVFGNSFFENCLRLQNGETRSESDDELIYTIKMYLRLNQNVTETAKALFVHRNTLNYRIEKFNKLTGLDCTGFEDGLKISIGFMIVNYLESQPQPGDEGQPDKRTGREQTQKPKKQSNKR